MYKYKVHVLVIERTQMIHVVQYVRAYYNKSRYLCHHWHSTHLHINAVIHVSPPLFQVKIGP